MSPERIVDHLKYVLEQEMVGFDEAALWLLGRSADGSMRDAMSLADQGVSFGSGKLLEPDVRNMLGTIDQTAVYDIIEALAAADGAQVLAAVDQLSEHAPDYVAALEELLTLLHRIAITQAVPEATDNSFGDKERVTDLAGRLAAENVQLFYQMGLNGRRDLPLAPDPRSGFEMVLLRMLAFMPAGIAQLPQGSVQNSAPVANNTAASAEAPEPVKKPEPVPQPSAVAEEPESKLPPAATPISLDQLNPTNWNQLFDRLGFGGVVGNIASHCVLQQIEGDTITLGLDENNATLFSDSYTARIQQHLSVTLNAPIKLKINVTPVQVETPSGRKQRLIKERRQQAFVDLQNDPNVQTLINDFSAVLVEESVEPVLHGARKQ